VAARSPAKVVVSTGRSAAHLLRAVGQASRQANTHPIILSYLPHIDVWHYSAYRTGINRSQTSRIGKVRVPRAACPPVPTLAASCQWHPSFKVDQYQTSRSDRKVLLEMAEIAPGVDPELADTQTNATIRPIRSGW